MPMYVTEYTKGAQDTFGFGVAAVMGKPIAAQNGITISAVAANSAAFNAQTSVIEVHTQEATCIAIGLAAVANALQTRMGAGETRYYGVQAGGGWRISGITPT